MASRFELAKVPKRNLRKATLYVERLQKEYWKIYLAFIWHVDNFLNLEDTVVYTHYIQVMNWNLKLKKKRFSAEVTINTTSAPFGCPWNISCYVRYDDGVPSTNTPALFDARQISIDSYEVTIPESAIKSQENYRLNRYGTLSLQFQFHEQKRECFHSNRYKRDYSQSVQSDVASILRNSIMTDFAIKPAEGRIIECHKAFLAARSIFFREYFNESFNHGNEISVSASFDILRIVVSYLYCVRDNVADITKLSDLMKLTWKLDIPSLKTVCIKCVSRIMNEAFEYLLKEEIKHGLTFMLEKLNTFLENANKIVQTEL